MLSSNVIRWVEREVANALNAPDDTSQHEDELLSLDDDVIRVVEAIAQVGISPALEVKLQEWEQRKIEVQVSLASNPKPASLPNRTEVREVWTGLVEGLGDLKDKATVTELEAARSAIKGLVGDIRVTREGEGYADVCLQRMVAGARFVR